MSRRLFISALLAALPVLAVGQNNITWTGSVDGDWDKTTANWTGDASTFNDGDLLTFGDGATRTAITITENVAPGLVTFNNSGLDYTLTGSSQITGTGQLRKQGSKSLVVQSANGYGGGTLMQGGTLELHDGGALGIGTITVSGGWFQFRYNDQTVENNIVASGGNIRCITDSATITLNGDITVPSGAAQFGAGNSTSVGRFNINGTISGVGGVTFANGNGSCNAHFYVYGSNTYAGTTSMVGWGGSGSFTLGFGHNNCLGSGVLAMGGQQIKAVMPDIVIPNNVTLDNPNIVGTNNLTFNGINTMPGDRLFRIYSSALTTFKVMAESGGSRSLTKTGSGTMAISGTSTYTGTTLIDQGTLLVDGTLAAGGGSVTVNTGAGLGGSGVIDRAVVVTNLATLAAGNAPGTLTVASLEFGENAIYNFSYGADDRDLVLVTGTLDLPVTAIINGQDIGGGKVRPREVLFSAGTLTGARNLSGWTINGLGRNAQATIQGDQVVVSNRGTVIQIL